MVSLQAMPRAHDDPRADPQSYLCLVDGSYAAVLQAYCLTRGESSLVTAIREGLWLSAEPIIMGHRAQLARKGGMLWQAT